MSKFIIWYTALIVGGIALFWMVGQIFTPYNESAASLAFVVKDNDSVFKIADQLTENGLVASRSIFLGYALASGRFDNLQPGTYYLSPALTVAQITKTLAQGPQDIRVVLYPGMTILEMDDRLASMGIIDAGTLASLTVEEFKEEFSFLTNAKTLEGFLMPDTYDFYPAHNARAIAVTLLENFEKEALPLLEGKKNSISIVVKASLIEKEVVEEYDRALVSGVIDNRLKIDMPLQIDATVLYGACGGKFAGCKIDRSAFSKDGPYNTYTNKGLPPAPISNPSVSSIKAALKPRVTSYLYYLSDRVSKKTFFSTTLNEHNEKRARYLGL